jgi:hypothetical protein
MDLVLNVHVVRITVRITVRMHSSRAIRPRAFT